MVFRAIKIYYRMRTALYTEEKVNECKLSFKGGNRKVHTVNSPPRPRERATSTMCTDWPPVVNWRGLLP